MLFPAIALILFSLVLGMESPFAKLIPDDRCAFDATKIKFGFNIGGDTHTTLWFAEPQQAKGEVCVGLRWDIRFENLISLQPGTVEQADFHENYVNPMGTVFYRVHGMRNLAVMAGLEDGAALFLDHNMATIYVVPGSAGAELQVFNTAADVRSELERRKDQGERFGFVFGRGSSQVINDGLTWVYLDVERASMVTLPNAINFVCNFETFFNDHILDGYLNEQFDEVFLDWSVLKFIRMDKWDFLTMVMIRMLKPGPGSVLRFPADDFSVRQGRVWNGQRVVTFESDPYRQQLIRMFPYRFYKSYDKEEGKPANQAFSDDTSGLDPLWFEDGEQKCFRDLHVHFDHCQLIMGQAFPHSHGRIMAYFECRGKK